MKGLSGEYISKGPYRSLGLYCLCGSYRSYYTCALGAILFFSKNKLNFSFSDGFNLVLPMEKLHAFSPAELSSILCGDQAPNWTREDILNYTEPKLGYTRDRLVYISWLKIFRIIPEYRILRLTFHRKSASKC